MAVKAVGVGIGKDGRKETFAVTDKTTKADLRRMLSKYKEISAIADVGHASVQVRTSFESALGGCREAISENLQARGAGLWLMGEGTEIERDALVSLIESGMAEVSLRLEVRPQETAHTPSSIVARLEQLERELPEEEE